MVCYYDILVKVIVTGTHRTCPFSVSSTQVWMSDVVPPTALSEVQLRFLCHNDIENVKLLCGDWFPIE